MSDGTLLHSKETDSGIVAGIFIAIAAAVVMILGFVRIVWSKAWSEPLFVMSFFIAAPHSRSPSACTGTASIAI